MPCGYECWDQIADGINPALALIAIGALAFSGGAKEYGRALWAMVLVIGLMFVYLMQWVDRAVSIWAQWGGDYSTHTAFAVAVVGALSALGRRWAIVFGSVFVLYVLLMLYQRYHSIADIVSSGGLLAIVVFGLDRLAKRLRNHESIAPAV